MKGFVYIIRDPIEDTYYIGSTDNIRRRTYQHAHGHTRTTSRMRIQEVVFIQEFDSLQMARKMELFLKKLKRKDYIAKIIKAGHIKKVLGG